MLSRIADSLYWMSRYLERVGNTARLIEINLLHLLEADEKQSPVGAWQPLLGINGHEQTYRTIHMDGEVSGARVLRFLTQERTNPSAIRSSLRLARDNARVVRDRISKEMWETLNELWLRADPLLARHDAAERMAPFCRFVRAEVARFHGVTVSTMMRGEAFGFYQLGTFVERADMTARILDVKYHLISPNRDGAGSALDYYQWAALLKSISGFEAYRRTHHAGLEPRTVSEFVILSPDFPRSLRFCTDRIEQALQAIGTGPGEQATLAAAALRAVLAEPPGTKGVNGVLHGFLQGFVARVGALDQALCDEFFQGVAGDIACVT